MEEAWRTDLCPTSRQAKTVKRQDIELPVIGYYNIARDTWCLVALFIEIDEF